MNDLLELFTTILIKGNRNAITDAVIALQLAQASMRASFLNIQINLKSITDDFYKADIEGALKEWAKRNHPCGCHPDLSGENLIMEPLIRKQRTRLLLGKIQSFSFFSFFCRRGNCHRHPRFSIWNHAAPFRCLPQPLSFSDNSSFAAGWNNNYWHLPKMGRKLFLRNE